MKTINLDGETIKFDCHVWQCSDCGQQQTTKGHIQYDQKGRCTRCFEVANLKAELLEMARAVLSPKWWVQSDVKVKAREIIARHEAEKKE